MGAVGVVFQAIALPDYASETLPSRIDRRLWNVPLDEFNPVTFWILRVDNSDASFAGGAAICRFGHKLHTFVAERFVHVLQVIDIEANVHGSQLVFVQVTFAGRWAGVVYEFELVPVFEAEKNELADGSGNARMIAFSRRYGIQFHDQVESQSFRVKTNHAPEILNHNPSVMKAGYQR